MSVKRYEWMACDEHACHCDVVESAEGDMVDYEDYAALEQKLVESQREFRAADATIENLQMKVEKLAAENAGLKAFGDKLYSMYKGLETSGGGFHDEQSIPYQQAAIDAAISAFEEIKTPETDASMAELRAQGVGSLSNAVQSVISERQRQRAIEGWTSEHDDAYQNSELADAAACYAINAHNQGFSTPAHWPWDPEWWKQSGPRRDLVKAGALILAEIERIDRTAAGKGETS